MEANKLLGLVLLATGVGDMAMVKFMGEKLAPAARSAILVSGGAFMLGGAALLLGYLRII